MSSGYKRGFERLAGVLCLLWGALHPNLPHVSHLWKRLAIKREKGYVYCVSNSGMPGYLSAQLSQSAEHEILSLGVVGSNPTLGGMLFWLVTVALQEDDT